MTPLLLLLIAGCALALGINGIGNQDELKLLFVIASISAVMAY